MARKALERVTWPAAAGHWVLGWLATSLVLLIVATVVAIVRLQVLSAPPQSQAMNGIMGAMAFGFSAAFIAVAMLVALPIQATALQLRCNKTGNAIFAAVAGLSFASAIVSVLVVRASDPLMRLVSPSPEQLTAGLIGFYLLHVVVLWIARWLAGRARRVGSPSAAF